MKRNTNNLSLVPLSKIKIFELSAKEMRVNAWETIRNRVKSQSLKSVYIGANKNGTLNFRTNSGTIKGHFWFQQIQFKDISVATELFNDDPTVLQRDVVSLIATGDLKVHCNCPAMKYYFSYKAWKEGYGIRKETRFPKIRNKYLTGSVCFPAGTDVLSEKGLRPIQEIKIGDLVYNSKGVLSKVINVGVRKSRIICYFKLANQNCIQCTEEHPFLMERQGKLEWIKAKDIKLNDKFTSPVLVPETKINSLNATVVDYFLFGYFFNEKSYFITSKSNVIALNKWTISRLGFSVIHLFGRKGNSIVFKKKDTKIGVLAKHYTTLNDVLSLDKNLLYYFIRGFLMKNLILKKRPEIIVQSKEEASSILMLLKTLYHVSMDTSLTDKINYHIKFVDKSFNKCEYCLKKCTKRNHLIYNLSPQPYYTFDIMEKTAEMIDVDVYSLSVKSGSYLVGYDCISAHNCKHILSALLKLPLSTNGIVRDYRKNGILDKDWNKKRNKILRKRKREGVK